MLNELVASASSPSLMRVQLCPGSTQALFTFAAVLHVIWLLPSFSFTTLHSLAYLLPPASALLFLFSACLLCLCPDNTRLSILPHPHPLFYSVVVLFFLPLFISLLTHLAAAYASMLAVACRPTS